MTTKYSWQIKTNFRFGGEGDWGYQNVWFQESDEMSDSGDERIVETFSSKEAAYQAAIDYIEDNEWEIEEPWDEEEDAPLSGPAVIDIRILKIEEEQHKRRIYVNGKRREDLEGNKLAETVLLKPDKNEL